MVDTPDGVAYQQQLNYGQPPAVPTAGLNQTIAIPGGGIPPQLPPGLPPNAS
jgi:hypothetical protein